jgi:hypothetical protein
MAGELPYPWGTGTMDIPRPAAARKRRLRRPAYGGAGLILMLRGARPDLSVDGTIELEHLDDVVYVGRPAFGQLQSTVGLFR